jgi:hypothetical protein
LNKNLPLNKIENENKIFCDKIALNNGIFKINENLDDKSNNTGLFGKFSNLNNNKNNNKINIFSYINQNDKNSKDSDIIIKRIVMLYLAINIMIIKKIIN